VLIYIIRIGVVSDITFGSSLYMAAHVVNSTYRPQAHKIYLLLSRCPNHVIIMPNRSCLYIFVCLVIVAMDLLPNEQNFDLDKSRQQFYHTLKEHHKISIIPKFRCEMLFFQKAVSISRA
jgi:hypothetical protein